MMSPVFLDLFDPFIPRVTNFLSKYLIDPRFSTRSSTKFQKYEQGNICKSPFFYILVQRAWRPILPCSYFWNFAWRIPPQNPTFFMNGPLPTI